MSKFDDLQVAVDQVNELFGDIYNEVESMPRGGEILKALAGRILEDMQNICDTAWLHREVQGLGGRAENVKAFQGEYTELKDL